ncbi:hypothetical protein DLAC_06115 [Tieghemostelium lacteum]|uniref:EGF-like domain-containing protein n=1 Tax=Tieghemostelium lacteum TaxID=361077 RepID=A0A151ZHN8_TIELA|nr:hypothetical protein DLAC_06115 [Tieghemostelium lacteum]|eukprot:KYQ93425.1 hypothetical protein DLAC_06115 [Tieghemostelium lacteum]
MLKTTTPTLVFLCIYFLLGVGLVSSQTTWNTGTANNGHIYTYFNTPVSYLFAVESCQSSSSYLVTISNFYEMQFVLTLIGNNEIWISSEQNNNGTHFSNFVYGTGPEMGGSIYDPNTDTSFTYSQWSPLTPTFTTVNSRLTVVVPSGRPHLFNNRDPTLNYGYVCESDGGNIPFIQSGSIPTTGGVLIISGLPASLNHSALSLVGNNINGVTLDITISNFITVSSTSVSVVIPAGTGGYYFTISDGGAYTSGALYFQYQPPKLRYIIPPPDLSQGSLTVSIVGSNFGGSTNLLDVQLSNGIACQSPSIQDTFEGYQMIICQVTGPLLDGFLPVFVKVDEVVTVSYRVPLYFAYNQMFYSLFRQSSTLAYAPTFLQNSQFNQMVPYMSILNDAELIGQVKSYSDPNTQLEFYQPIQIETLPHTFKITQGPNTGVIFDYGSGIDTSSIVDYTVPFFITVSDTPSLTSFNTTAFSYLCEFRQLNPPAFIGIQNILMNTNGGYVIINLNNYGVVSSVLSATCVTCPGNMGSLQLTRVNSGDPTAFLLTLPAGISGPYSFKVTIDSLTSQQSEFDYFPPAVTSVTPAKVTGGMATIFGGNFGQLSSDITINVPGKIITNINFVGSFIEFQITEGTGLITSKLQVGNKVTFFNFTYEAPSISSVLQNSQDTYVEITGSNFGFNLTQISVTYSDKPCTVFSIQDNFLRCYLPKYAQNGFFKISVNGISMTSDYGYNLTPFFSSVTKSAIPQGPVTISGFFWSTQSYDGTPLPPEIITAITDTNSRILNLTCTLNLFTSGPYQYQIQCMFLPFISTTFYQISVVYNTQSYVQNSGYQLAEITQATPIPQNQRGNVTVVGSNFGEIIDSVAIGGRACTSFQRVTSGKVLCDFDGLAPVSNPSIGLEVSIVFGDQNPKRNAFFYTKKIPCPGVTTPCSSHGTCNENNGQCTCESGYDAFDCSVQVPTPSTPPPKPVSTDNSTIIIGSNTTSSSSDDNESSQPSYNFKVGITHIRELTFSGDIVRVLSLVTDIKWVELKEFSENKTLYYRGIFPEKSSLVLEVYTTYYEEPSNYVFGGEDFHISRNSMKLLIHMFNYTFDKETNSLEVIYLSKTSNSISYDCETVQSIPNFGGGDTSDNQTIDWFEINSGGAIFKASFSRRMIVDNRYRLSKVIVLPSTDTLYQLSTASTNEEFNLYTAIVTPYFENDCYLDPNFAVLTTVDYQDKNGKTCNENDEFPRWKIATIVVCAGVGFISLIIILVYVFYQKSLNLRIKSLKFTKLFK